MGAGLAALLAESTGFVGGIVLARFYLQSGFRLDAKTILDRRRLTRLLAINSDIMLRTAALITAFFFFTAQGARSGDVTLAANAVLHNFTLIGSFFLDGFATAAEQLCGRAIGARRRDVFAQSVRLIIIWSFAFGLALSAALYLVGDLLINVMTTNAEVRSVAKDFMLLAALAPAFGVLAYAYDGIFIGATWTRAMRNLMLAALAIYFAVWWIALPLGNAGLWFALLTFLIARGALQAARYPALLRRAF